MMHPRLFTYRFATLLTLGMAGFVAGLLLAACPNTGIVCSPGTRRCGLGCADFSRDPQNCGACGVACQSLQICQNSQCQCQPGSTLCGGSCSVTSSDPQNCGGCAGDGGMKCNPDQVCDPGDGGQCTAQCTTPGLVACSQGCVDLHSDPNNCGECGHRCLQGQGCHRVQDGGSCAFDVVAACIDTGQVVGIQAGTDVVSPLYPFGTNPQALGAMQDDAGERTLLEADFDQELRQMRLADGGLFTNMNMLGNSPNHILVDDRYIYIVNRVGHTFQILRRTGDAAGAAGLPLLSLPPDRGFDFGDNTFPQSIAKLGTNLYIALSGGPTGIDAGIAQVNVSDPSSPVLIRTVSFSSLDLKSFDGGVTYPRPSGIASHQGSIYVALSNLDPADAPGGPAIVAQLNVDTGTLVVPPIYLQSDAGGPDISCLNTYWLVSSGNVLYVSCSGRGQYDSTSHLTGIDSSTVVALNPDGGRIAWSPACPGDGGCFGPAIKRFAVINDRLYLGDQLGRIFVLQNVGGGFVERRGYDFVSGGPPIAACPPSPSGYSRVQDVISVP